MTKIGTFIAAFIILTGATQCGRPKAYQDHTSCPAITIDVLNKYTPVKNQGQTSLCWAYAMLSTIETEHLMQGDSISLSAAFVLRSLMQEAYRRHVLTGGRDHLSDRAMGQTLINLLQEYGARPLDSYRGLPPHAFHSPDGQDLLTGSRTLLKETRLIAQKAVRAGTGPTEFSSTLEAMLDERLGSPAPKVYMLGAEYTPQEFARSVCRPDEYLALTSFTHHPFYKTFPLEVPDNWEQNHFLNLPLDSMMTLLDKAVRQGHGVCWEGDVSEPGFSPQKGIATVVDKSSLSSDATTRQQLFERRRTTDDHCMAIIGIGHDEEGNKFYLMKNSWGATGPLKGLIWVSETYVRLKTIALYLPRVVAEKGTI